MATRVGQVRRFELKRIEAEDRQAAQFVLEAVRDSIWPGSSGLDEDIVRLIHAAAVWTHQVARRGPSPVLSSVRVALSLLAPVLARAGLHATDIVDDLQAAIDEYPRKPRQKEMTQ